MSLRVKGAPMKATELRALHRKLEAIAEGETGVNFATLKDRLDTVNMKELGQRWANLFTGDGKPCPLDIYKDRDLLSNMLIQVEEITGMLERLQNMWSNVLQLVACRIRDLEDYKEFRRV